MIKRKIFTLLLLGNIFTLQAAQPAPAPSPAPTGSVLPPSNFQGSSHVIGLLNDTVYYNQLDWGMPSSGNVPTSGYLIYKDGVLVMALSAEEFTWQDLDVPQESNTSVLYTIISLAGTTQSAPLSIEVFRLE